VSTRFDDFIAGRLDTIAISDGLPVQNAKPPWGLYPGAFNPPHEGHWEIARIATTIVGQPIHFEISVANVDKPEVGANEILNRLNEFPKQETVWLTRAATFSSKSAHFPNAVFVVGADTIQRVADARYYDDDVTQMHKEIQTIADRGNTFLVFGRKIGDNFCTLDDLRLPELLTGICTAIPESSFRRDISSTELRQKKAQEE
jgi:nicotinic acid mononucleotide adenylyltransferase